MENVILIALLFLFSNLSYSQSLIIYKSDQTSLNFNLSDVDSITFSVASLGKSFDLSNDEVGNTISGNEESLATNKSVDKGTDEKSKQIIQEDLEKSTSGSITDFKKE